MNRTIFIIPKAYDREIYSATDKYLPDWVDWRWLKAQLYQESGLTPKAVSKAGAKGIAQFMDATWGEVKESMSMPEEASPFDPAVAIPAAAWYMRKLYDQWIADRPQLERWKLTLASYNAGFGNMLKAQKLANSIHYEDIMRALPKITGNANAKETSEYIRLIEMYYKQLIQE